MQSSNVIGNIFPDMVGDSKQLECCDGWIEALQEGQSRNICGAGIFYTKEWLRCLTVLWNG